MTRKPTQWNILFSLLVGIALLGCTSVYQIRGVEEPLEEELLVDQVEREDPALKSSNLVKTVEARSVEALRLCKSGGRRDLTEGHCTIDPEPFRLGVLEVDQNGTLNPKQRRQVFGMLEEEAAAARQADHNLVIVLFIHGWHHGASVCDYNLACLRRLVGGMANVYGPERTDENKPSRFVGLYLGWRGESVETKGFNALTIYHRKQTAEKIGHSGATNLLLDIDEEYRRLKALAEAEDSGGDEPDKVFMLTAGHSLGGAMLLSALRQKLEGTVAGKTYIRSSHATGTLDEGQRPMVTGFGDLSILLNPAIQAARFQAFADDLTAVIGDGGLSYDSDQTPVLLAVTSEADTATGRAFPTSRWLLPQNWFRGAAYRQALGHYDRYRTHDLSSELEVDHVYTSGDRPLPCGCPLYVVGDGLSDLPRPMDPAASFTDRLEEALELATLGERAPAGSSPDDPAYSLDPVFEAGWDENSPFWVIRADRNVIESHNDIYNEALMRFVVLFLNTIFETKGF